MSRFIQVKNFGFSLDAVISWQRDPEEVGSPLIVNFMDSKSLKFTDEEAEQVHQLLNSVSTSLSPRSVTSHRFEAA